MYINQHLLKNPWIFAEFGKSVCQISYRYLTPTIGNETFQT